MKKNVIRRSIFHAALHPAAFDSGTKRLVFVALAVVVSIAAVVAVFFALKKMRGICHEPCAVESVARQVDITAGQYIPTGVITESLGIKPGANLAEIDFAQKRRDALKKIPALRSITIERRLPDRLIVVAEERDPVARIETAASKRHSGRVVDTEGVVFSRFKGTKLLPVIRERPGTQTPNGETIDNRLLAALRLIEATNEADFSEIQIAEVDCAREDCLLAILDSGQRIKIRWEAMDDPSPASTSNLRRLLSQIKAYLESNIGRDAPEIYAAGTDRIFVDTKEPIQ